MILSNQGTRAKPMVEPALLYDGGTTEMEVFRT